MSRRHLTLAVIALASLAATACSSSPTAPESGLRSSTASHDVTPPTTTPPDTTGRSGWSGSF